MTEIKRRLAAGELGGIFQVHARRLSPFPGRISDVGVILDLAIHDIDVMHHLLGADVERVFAETEQKAHATCEDLVSALIRFSNGVIGLLDVNWLTPTKGAHTDRAGRGRDVRRRLPDPGRLLAQEHGAGDLLRLPQRVSGGRGRATW